MTHNNPNLMGSERVVKWRRKPITLVGRFVAGLGPVRMSTEPVSCYGRVAVHLRDVDFLKPDRDDPESWSIVFPTWLPRTWVVSHITTGLRLSCGKGKHGFNRQWKALFMAEQLARYGHVLACVRAGAELDDAVERIAAHPDFLEMKAHIQEVEELVEKVKNRRAAVSSMPLPSL